MKSETSSNALFKICMPRLVIGTVLIPFTAFLLCIYISVKKHFEASTATHCGVPNYLPSISAAIGEFVPQRYIWRLAIALQSAPRFMVAGMYVGFMKRILPRQLIYKKLRNLATVLNLVENVALLGLSFVSSKENYEIHKVFFTTFMVCSELYMLLFYLLLKDNVSMMVKPTERKSFKRKKQLMVVNFSSFFFALYFFYRHNAYCEPGMYTMFAFLEYMVVLSNMAFHMTAYYDFYDYELVIAETSSLS